MKNFTSLLSRSLLNYEFIVSTIWFQLHDDIATCAPRLIAMCHQMTNFPLPIVCNEAWMCKKGKLREIKLKFYEILIWVDAKWMHLNVPINMHVANGWACNIFLLSESKIKWFECLNNVYLSTSIKSWNYYGNLIELNNQGQSSVDNFI